MIYSRKKSQEIINLDQKSPFFSIAPEQSNCPLKISCAPLWETMSYIQHKKASFTEHLVFYL